MPRVSVVMPVLNEERSVREAVASVLNQTFTDLELFVVDGASSDNTVRLVQEIAENEPRVHLLKNPKRTIPNALNVALEHARGEYLARVDGHAAVNDQYLEIGIATLDASPDVAAVGGKRIGVARTPAGVAVATALSSRFGVGGSINHYGTEPQDTDHASFGIFRVDVLRKIDGWDPQLTVNEDVDLDHRIMGVGYRIRFDPAMHIYWHVRESVSALARQYRRYGRGKAAMVRKNGRDAVRGRHLAPPVLVLALIGAGLAAVAGAWPLTVMIVVPYALAVVGATVVTLRTAEPVSSPGDAVTYLAGDPSGNPGRRANPFQLAASFVAMHCGWGLGFLEGYFLRLPPAGSSAKIPSTAGESGAAPAAVSDAARPAAGGADE